MTILNADGLYLTSYRVLHLNIKLRMEGHYHRPEDERYPSISGITDNKEQVVVACMLLYLEINKKVPMFEVKFLTLRKQNFSDKKHERTSIYIKLHSVCD